MTNGAECELRTLSGPDARDHRLSHCRFSIALQPLRIGDLGDFVGIVTDHLQFIWRERRMVRRLSAG
jgi:hypothetical protein